VRELHAAVGGHVPATPPPPLQERQEARA